MKKIKQLLRFTLTVALVLVGTFGEYQITQAVGGQGTATIDGSAPGGNVTVTQSTSHKFTVVLSIGDSGITADAQNPTFTIPTGFTAPDATPVANAGLVVADGDWSVSAAGGICTVENPTAGLTVAVGQLITVDVTTTCTVAVPDTITLTYQGQSASTMAATALVIKTADDIGWGAVTAIAAPPTITVTAADVTAPTVTVTMDDDALNISDTSLVTFTFSETPVGFTTADVTVANGAIGAIDTSNPLVQTATYTPTNGITDATNVITVGTAWTDAALNTGVGDDSPNYTIDTVAPSVTVTMSDAVLTFGETSLVTFTFSETPVSFTTADVTVANGTIGAIDASNPLIQTATYTPTNGLTDATNVITVGTAWTDAALNTGVGDDSPNYTIDTIAPQLIVNKVVVNDNGGTKVISDFSLFIDSSSVTSGVASTTTIGLHTVSETADSGYTTVIGGNCATNGTITLASGDVKTCTVTNDDIAPVVPTTSGGGGSGGGSYPLIPPLIDVVKVPSPLALPGGSGLVKYTYTLRNIGTVPVANITMVGDTCSPITLVSGDTNADARLDVNETWIHTCSTTLTKTHTNIVTAIGWGWERGFANGISATDIANATVVVGIPVVPPLIHVVKKPNLFVVPIGGAVTYTYTVTNPGTAPLSNVSISDDKCTGLPGRVVGHPGDLNKNNLLESNEAWSFTCQSRLFQTTVNTGTAEGTANGLTARDFAIATVVVTLPILPNTGIPPEEKSAPWNVIIPAGVFITLFSFYLTRKKKAI